MDGTHLKDKAEWETFKADLEKRCCWSVNYEPTHYPVVVLHHYDYNHRYAQNKLVFQFVYLKDFLGYVDRAHWHLYQLSPGSSQYSLPFYLGEVFPNEQPDGSMAFLYRGSSAASHVKDPALKFCTNGIRVTGTNVKGDDVLFLLTQNRFPDGEVDYLE